MSGRRLISLTAFCAIVALCCTPASPAPAAPYKIDVIVSLTGSYAFVGGADAQTLQLRGLREPAGGFAAQPIHFVIHDDQSSPANAVQLSTQLLRIIRPSSSGSNGGSLCSAMMPLFKDGPVMYCLVPSIYPPKDGYVFSRSRSIRSSTG